MDESVRLIISSSIANGEAHIKMCGYTDVGNDDNLLVAKMTLKLRNAKIGMARNQRPDISELKDTIITEKFSITPRNRFSILQDEMA